MGERAEGNEIQKHVFTHYVSLGAVEKTIGILKQAAFLIEKNYKGKINSDELEAVKSKARRFI